MTVRVKICHNDPTQDKDVRISSMCGPAYDKEAAFYDVLKPGEEIELTLHKDLKLVVEEFDG